MNAALETKVVFFTHLKPQGYHLPIREILEGIEAGRWAGEIANLRAVGRSSPGYEKKKARLPSFMLSGITSGGRKAADVIEHSGLLQIDVDGVGAESAPDLRDRVGEDRHILAAWISPSGDGVKAIMRVPADVASHKAFFEAAAHYMRETFGRTIDAACSDVSRQCFVSHDPDLVRNEACQPLSVAGLGLAQSGGSSSICLDPPSSILYNTVLYNTTGVFRDWPLLEPFYKRHVLNLFPDPQPGQRNTILKDLVPSLMSIVKPEFVAALALEYYHQHETFFEAYPLADWRRQIESLVTGCLDDYPARLGQEERDAYLALPDSLHQAAFRICRSLSQYPDELSLPPPLFCLSCNQLGIRLGLFPPQAQRILRSLERQGILRTERKGERYDPLEPPPKGKRLKATIFRWLLATSPA